MRIQDTLTSIECSEEEKLQLQALAGSTTAGIWRVKRAKIILGAMEGKTVDQLVLLTRVPPRSIVRCCQDFAQQRMDYFKNPDRAPTVREASVERILAFLDQPRSPTHPDWSSLTHRYIGIHFSARRIQVIRELIASDPHTTRKKLAEDVCMRFRLIQSNGKPKVSTMADILYRMDMDNVITLPKRETVTRSPSRFRQKIDEPLPLQDLPDSGRITSLRFAPVTTQDESRLWNRLIHNYHYINTYRLFGPRLRYLVYGVPGSDPDRSHDLFAFPGEVVAHATPELHPANPQVDLPKRALLVAALGFAPAAWRVASRDAFIGWTDAQRVSNLRYVVGNARFLILPWIRCHNLASRILSGAAKRLPGDWDARYSYRPVLLETFVQLDRFAGTCYKAANWIQLGTTSGYSLYGKKEKKRVPTKAMFVYPLTRRFREVLCRDAPP